MVSSRCSIGNRNTTIACTCERENKAIDYHCCKVRGYRCSSQRKRRRPDQSRQRKRERERVAIAKVVWCVPVHARRGCRHAYTGKSSTDGKRTVFVGEGRVLLTFALSSLYPVFLFHCKRSAAADAAAVVGCCDANEHQAIAVMTGA